MRTRLKRYCFQPNPCGLALIGNRFEGVRGSSALAHTYKAAVIRMSTIPYHFCWSFHVIMGFDINNKAALVTGGGRGICLCFAKDLLAGGCHVVIADLALTAQAENLIAAPSTAGSGRAVFMQTDVTNWKQLRAAFDKALAEFGRLDIVCPGAGIFEPVRDLERIPAANAV